MAITWTVIGTYDLSGETWAEHFEADDAHAAMAAAAVMLAAQERDEDMMIVGAVPGAHIVHPPCEDSGRSAWAVDLLPQD